MNKHEEIINTLKNYLIIKGNVIVEPTIDLDFGSNKFRPDLLFENNNSGGKVIIEVKNNENNLNISLGTLSYITDLKQFLDTKTNYKFVVIFTKDLSPNFSTLISGRVTYYSLKENSIENIANFIYEKTIPNNPNK